MVEIKLTRNGARSLNNFAGVILLSDFVVNPPTFGKNVLNRLFMCINSLIAYIFASSENKITFRNKNFIKLLLIDRELKTNLSRENF